METPGIEFFYDQIFYSLNFQVIHIEFREKMKTLFTVCKYLHYFRRYLSKKITVKYANEMTDDVIHIIQYHIKYKFAVQTIQTWQANSFTRNTPKAIKTLLPWRLTLFQYPPTCT